MGVGNNIIKESLLNIEGGKSWEEYITEDSNH